MASVTLTDVETLDALMAQPFAAGIRREQMNRIWDAYLQDALDWTHAHAATAIVEYDGSIPYAIWSERLLPPYAELFNAALTRIVDGDAAVEEEGRRAAQDTIRAGDARWAQITREAAGLRRESLT